MLDLDPWYLLVAMVSSSIGLGAFIFGKRCQEPKFLGIGAALMGASYFVHDPLWLLLLSILLGLCLVSKHIQYWMAGKPPSSIEKIPTRQPKKR